MRVIESGKPVRLSFDRPESQAAKPLTVLWRVVNEDGQSIHEGSSEYQANPDGLEEFIEVSGNLNDIGDALTGSRMVVLTYSTDPEQPTQRFYYAIQAPSPLRAGVNSCQTMLKAMSLLPQMPPLDGWNSHDEAARVGSMVGAFEALKYIELKPGSFGENVLRQRRAADQPQATCLADLSPLDWPLLPKEFVESFSRAQILEANHILSFDTPESLRERGVLSYSSGEVKQFFRTQKPVELGVCKAALKAIGRYVEYSRRIGRG